MCVVSMIMDHYKDKWEPSQPFVLGGVFPPLSPTLPTPQEMEEFRKLLERAREYDKKNNEPDCELQEKKDALLAIAKKLGIDISFV